MTPAGNRARLRERARSAARRAEMLTMPETAAVVAVLCEAIHLLADALEQLDREVVKP